MAKASPLLRGFTAGEFSPFMEGRTDIDPFALSLRKMENFIATPQGPIVRRSGTQFYGLARDETSSSKLLPFSFNEDQSFVLEFSTNKVRFYSDAGVLSYGTVSITAADVVNNTITAAGLGAAVGDTVVLGGFVPSANLNGQVVTVTAVSGSVYTINKAPVGFQAGANAQRAYEVTTGFDAATVASLRFVTSLDTVLLLSPLQAPARLVRTGPLSWSFDTPGLAGAPFSASYGWPTAGCFFGDRLWLAGAATKPDVVVGSQVANYYNFAVGSSDSSPMSLRINARRLGQVGWMRSDARGLLIGTGAGIWSIASADGASTAITPTSVEAKLRNARGVAQIDCAQVDDDTLFVQRARRSTRALQFNSSESGYSAKSVSVYASHIGAIHSFKRIEYAEEPNTTLWHCCDDGTLAGLTYDKDQKVGGWHRHVLDGAIIEDIAVIPSPAAVQDALWMQTVRVINGQTRRFIEKMMPAWDFDVGLNDAWYVDCGLSYSGSPISVVFGLWFLEGETVYGVADGSPITPLKVVNGSVTLPAPASQLVLGKGMSSRMETQRMEAGAADGTAQGKTKRINKLVVRLFNSAGGRIGRPTTEEGGDTAAYEDFVFRASEDKLGAPVALFSGDYEHDFPAGYDKEGTILIEAVPQTPLPFNVVALMPQVNTQDR